MIHIWKEMYHCFKIHTLLKMYDQTKHLKPYYLLLDLSTMLSYIHWKWWRTIIFKYHSSINLYPYNTPKIMKVAKYVMPPIRIDTSHLSSREPFDPQSQPSPSIIYQTFSTSLELLAAAITVRLQAVGCLKAVGQDRTNIAHNGWAKQTWFDTNAKPLHQNKNTHD